MQQYSNNLTDAAGNAIPFASVTVYDANGAKAQLFADKDGTQPTDNPVKCDVLGRFAFHAKNGRYYPKVSGTGIAAVDIGEILLFDGYNSVTALASTQQSMEDAVALLVGLIGQADKPTVTGSRGGNAALASLLTGLAAMGLIVNSTTA